MDANELRIGNLVYCPSHYIRIMELRDSTIIAQWESTGVGSVILDYSEISPIPLTEEWLQKLGFSVINESSSGKRYGYVVDGVFSSDLTFTFWKTTKEVGKFFRGDLELKSVHQLQNLYFALTGAELTVA